MRPKSMKNAYTFSPSVTGLGDAGLFGFIKWSFRFRGTSFRHRSLPVRLSIAIVNSLLPSNPVMKTFSRPSTGEECPAGVATFQMTFLFGPNSAGRFDVLETPVPLGPRNWDHSSPGPFAGQRRDNVMKLDRKSVV